MSNGAVKATSRAANKVERETRRAEIIKRWNKRASVRIVQSYIDGNKGTVPGLVSAIIWQSKWTPTVGLTTELDFANINVSGLIGHLIRIIHLKEMSYDEYLQTPEWKSTADMCKKRYDQRCALDATHTADHAHHRTYERRGREDMNDLIPLCAACHAKHHGRRA